MKKHIGLFALAAILSWGTATYALDPTISASPAPSGQITGQLDRIQGDIYTVKDPAGREVTFRVDKDTKWEGSPKVGDQVEASIAPDGSADYVRKISGAKNRGSSGSESSPPFGR